MSNSFNFGTGVQPQQQNDQNIFALLSQLFGQQAQQQQNFVPENLTALRNDPQGDANRAYVPGQSGPGNPFTNGFFKNPGGTFQGGFQAVDPVAHQNTIDQMKMAGVYHTGNVLDVSQGPQALQQNAGWTPRHGGAGMELPVGTDPQNPFSDSNYAFAQGGLSKKQTGPRKSSMKMSKSPFGSY